MQKYEIKRTGAHSGPWRLKVMTGQRVRLGHQYFPTFERCVQAIACMEETGNAWCNSFWCGHSRTGEYIGKCRLPPSLRG